MLSRYAMSPCLTLTFKYTDSISTRFFITPLIMAQPKQVHWTIASKPPQDAVFYDNESPLAKACQQFRRDCRRNRWLEPSARRQLIYNAEKDFIRQTRRKQSLHHTAPCTPPESDEDIDSQTHSTSPAFGVTKYHRPKGIMHATKDLQLLDEHGTNLLQNDVQLSDPTEFGIYTHSGIAEQALIVPDHPSICGDTIIDTATATTTHEPARRHTPCQTSKRARKAAKRRRYRQRRRLRLQQQHHPTESLECKELVQYLSRIQSTPGHSLSIHDTRNPST